MWDSPEHLGWQTLSARLEERTRYAAAIDAVSHAISAALNTQSLLEIALERAATATGASGGMVYLKGPSGHLSLAVSRTISEQAKSKLATLDPMASRIAQLLYGKSPAGFSQPASEAPYMIGEFGKSAGVQSWIAGPITTAGTLTGLFLLFSRAQDTFTPAHHDLLRVLGQLVGTGLTTSRTDNESSTAHRDTTADLEAILEAMPVAVIISDPEGRVVRANEAAAQVLGTRTPALIGHSLLTHEWNAIPGQPLSTGPGQTEGSIWRVLRLGQDDASGPISLRVRGNQRTFSASAAALKRPGGMLNGAVVVLRDITRDHRLDEMRREFLGLLSHELRGPLTVISGYAQMLVRKLGKQGMDGEVAQAALIKEHAQRMASLVSDLVETGRLESGLQTLDLEPVDLGQFLDGVVGRVRADFAHAAATHPFALAIDSKVPPIRADARRLDQVITNLLSNAIKYSRDTGEISISAYCPQPDANDEVVRIEVTDQGVGIPDDEKDLIFERTFRGRRGSEVNAQGLGLGLYICKLVVEAHGGEIGVQDNPSGPGSRFWLNLPIKPPAQE